MDYYFQRPVPVIVPLTGFALGILAGKIYEDSL